MRLEIRKTCQKDHLKQSTNFHLDLPGVSERTFYKCPEGEYFDNTLPVPDCAPAVNVQSCGKIVGPDSKLMKMYKQFYETFQLPDDIGGRFPLFDVNPDDLMTSNDFGTF